MREGDGWVLLMECHDVAELHALRAPVIGAALAIAAHNRRVQAAAPAVAPSALGGD